MKALRMIIFAALAVWILVWAIVAGFRGNPWSGFLVLCTFVPIAGLVLSLDGGRR